MKETELLSHIEAQLKTLEDLRDELKRGGVAVSSAKEIDSGSSGQGVTPEGETASEVTSETDSWSAEHAVTPRRVAAPLSALHRADSLTESVTRLKRAADADQLHKASVKNNDPDIEVKPREDINTMKEREEARRNTALAKQRQHLQVLSAKKVELEQQRLEKAAEDEKRRNEEMAKLNKAAKERRSQVQAELEAQRIEEENLRAQLRKSADERRSSAHSSEKKREKERQLVNSMEFKRRMEELAESKQRKAQEMRKTSQEKETTRQRTVEEAQLEEEEVLRPSASFVVPSHKARQVPVAEPKRERAASSALPQPEKEPQPSEEKKPVRAQSYTAGATTSSTSTSASASQSNTAASSQLRARFRILSQDVDNADHVVCDAVDAVDNADNADNVDNVDADPLLFSCVAAACLLLCTLDVDVEAKPAEVAQHTPTSVPSPPPKPREAPVRSPPDLAFSSNKVETLRSEVKEAGVAEGDGVAAQLKRFEHLTKLMKEKQQEKAEIPAEVKTEAKALNVMAAIRQLRESANVSYRAAKYEEASRIYTKALQLHLKNPTGNSHKEKYEATIAALYLNRSASFMMITSYQEALRDAERAGDIEPKNPKPMLRMAKLYLFLGNPRQSRVHYTKAQKMSSITDGLAAIAPTLSSELKALSLCEAALKHLGAAQHCQSLEAAQGALDILPCLYFQQLKYGSMIMLTPQQALKELAKLQPQHPQNADVLHLLAKASFYTNHDRVSTHNSLQFLAKALLLEPQHGSALHLQTVISSFEQLRDEGSTAYEAGVYTQAYACYSKALLLDPNNKHLKAVVVLNRAAVLLQQGSYDAALEDCTTSLLYDANNHKGYARRARCHHLLGNVIAEIKDLKQAIRLHGEKGEREYGERLVAAEEEFACRFKKKEDAKPEKTEQQQRDAFYCRGRSSFKRFKNTAATQQPADKEPPPPSSSQGSQGGYFSEPFFEEKAGGNSGNGGNSAGARRTSSSGANPKGNNPPSPSSSGRARGSSARPKPKPQSRQGAPKFQYQSRFRKGFEFKGFNFKGYTTGGAGGGGGGGSGGGHSRFPHKPPVPPQPSMYELLGVKSGASTAEIKSAYHKQAMRWHPDKCINASDEEKKTAESRFKDLSEAYATLSDGQKRKAYDGAKKH